MSGPYNHQLSQDKIMTTAEEIRAAYADDLNRSTTYTRVARAVEMVTPGGRWLDVGCSGVRDTPSCVK